MAATQRDIEDMISFIASVPDQDPAVFHAFSDNIVREILAKDDSICIIARVRGEDGVEFPIAGGFCLEAIAR